MEADSCEIEEGEGNKICKIESLQPIGGVTLQIFLFCLTESSIIEIFWTTIYGKYLTSCKIQAVLQVLKRIYEII